MTPQEREIALHRVEWLLEKIEDEAIDIPIALAEIYVKNLWEIADDSFDEFIKLSFDQRWLKPKKANDLVVEALCSGRFEYEV
jgi:hypothetical protein